MYKYKVGDRIQAFRWARTDKEGTIKTVVENTSIEKGNELYLVQ